MQTRRIFLTPNWRASRTLHPVDTAAPPVTTPVEWGYIASGEADCILDAYLLDEVINNTCRYIVHLDPELVVISSAPNYLYWRCPPLNVDLVATYVSELRTQGCRAQIMIVGPHGTVDPLWVLERTEADLVFRGEIDGNVVGGVSIDELATLPFVISRSTGSGVIAPQRGFTDGRHIRYRAIPKLQEYEPHGWGGAVRKALKERYSTCGTLFEFARGCSYSCEFCLRAGFRNKLRIKPIDVFEDEIQEVVEKGVGYGFFIDENFGRPKEKYFALAEMIKKYGIKFGFQARPDSFVLDDIRFLKNCGCVYIEFGAETLERGASEALGKLSDYTQATEMIDFAKANVDFVFANVFDVSRVVSGKVNLGDLGQKDNEGIHPSPFIAYPGTAAGDYVLRSFLKQGVKMPSWELCEALFILDSARSGFVAGIADDLMRMENEVEALRYIASARNEREAGTLYSKTRFEGFIEPVRR